MAELSKQALKVENNTEFPNNNNGQITPSRLRTFNEDMIDSLVDEITYNADSASWNAQIQALDPSGSAQSIAALNAFTASADQRLDSLEAATSSYAISSSVAAVDAAQQAQINSLIAGTGSYVTSAITASSLVTASFDNGTRNLTFTKGDASTFAVNIPDASGSAGTFVTTSSFNAYTASTDSDLASLHSFTSSQQGLNTTFATTGSNTFTGQQNIQNFLYIEEQGNPLIYTQFSQDLLTNKLNVNQAGASGIVFNNIDVNMGQLTASLQEGYVWVGDASGRTKTVATSSFIDTINTGSFATTGSNTFRGNQNVEGDITISGSGTNSNHLLFTRPNAGDIFRIGASDNGNTYDFTITGSTNQQLWLIDNQGGTYLNTFMAPTNMEGRLSINNTFTASLQEGYAYVGNSSGKTAAVPTSSFGGGSIPAGTISSSAQITNLGFVSSSVTASSLITASAAGSTITFTKGDASTFSVSVDTGSAGTTLYEVVYTGENITKGDPLYISGSQGANPIVYRADAAVTAKMPVTFVSAETIAAGTTTEAIVLGLIEGIDLTGYTAGQEVYVAEGGGWSTSKPSGSASITQLLGVVTKGGSGGKGLVLNPGPATLPGLDNGKMWVGNANNQPTEISTASFASTGSNTFNGNQIVSGYVSASNGFFANDNTTTLTVGEGSNIRFISGSSYYNVQLVPSVGDMAFSRDGVSNVKTFTLAGAAGNSTTFQNNTVEVQSSVPSFIVQAATQSFSASGNFSVSANTLNQTAVTAQLQASSSFIGTVGITGQSGNDGRAIMLGHSGSLVLGNSTSNTFYSAMNHISSSAANGNTNLIFKTNTNTADTILSGSGNIFVNPSAPTAGFKRYMTGGNIAIGGSGVAVPQISGSMAWSPTIANNIFANSSNPITYRGPVSASASTINNNVFAGGAINLGTAAATNFERQQNGLSMNNNVLGGTINAVAAKTPLSASSTIGNNILVGTMTLNMDSSSVNANGNMINGGVTVNNSYLPGTINSTSGFVGFNTSNVNGTLSAYFSGSNTSFTGAPRAVTSILSAGGPNVISASFNGDYSSVNSLGLIGSSLLVYGNQNRVGAASDATWGGAFVGRWNALNGNRAYTADTVFAVGTGTAEASRKTGFLIDSGSNTFVEGSLNVSGSTSLTGSFRANIPTASAENQINLFNWAPFVGANGTTYTSANFSLQDYASSGLDQTFVIEYANADFQKYTGFVVGPTTAGSKLQFSVNTGVGYDFDEISLTDNGDNTSTALIKSDTNILRGATQITGSLSVSSSISIQSGSYTGNVVTNITPVSSSLQPVLNIVTMTSAEYALITPNSQTLYVIV